VEPTITFTSATVKELTTRLRLAMRLGQVWLIQRISALLMLNDGLATYTIASRLGVSTTAIYAWRDAFLVKRWQSLTRGKSSGRPPKLTPGQRARLKELILAGPEQAGYDTGCWNAALIQHLIQREFGKTYHVHYLSTLLKNLGFSYQKARFISDHHDPDARKEWCEVTWPAILREARRRGALILFADEASFAQWGSLSYTWALRGHQPTVKTTGKRKAYKMMGMIDYFSGRLFFQGSTERFTAARYCAFLETILAETTQPIMVVHDGASYHKAAATTAFVAQHADRLSVHPLPSYSPDYNPIEHLWRNVKRDKTHNRYFPTFEDLVQAVETGMAKFQQDSAAVRQLIGPYLEETVDCALAA
jgi:transposase